MVEQVSNNISFQHQFRYTFNEPVTVKELTDSLQGYERLAITYLPRVLNSLFDTEVVTLSVLVREISQGSLCEKLIFDLLFKDEETYRNFCNSVRRITGIDAASQGNYMRLICVLIMVALLAYGVSLAKGDKKAAIQQNTINILNLNAEETYIPGEKIVELVEEIAANDKKKVAENAIKVMRPAKKYQGEIELGEQQIKPVSSEIIAELPDKVEMEDAPIIKNFKDIDVQIRATDRDKDSGWAAIIEGVVERRVRLILPADINKDSLANNKTVRADVSVQFKISKTGELEAQNITLERLTEQP